MDHGKDGGAVEELRAALVAHKDKLQDATDDQVYDTIDKMMTRIAKTHSMSGQKLHDMWVSKYKQVPDTWIIKEAFDQPYSFEWEEGEDSEAVDALATLGDGTYLSIMFSKEFGDSGDDLGDWSIEFHRNNSQEVTGEGDAQRVFATVLEAIRQFVKKYKANTITFSAMKELDPTTYYGPDDVVPNPESRAKLYNRLVQRYAGAMGYSATQREGNGKVTYTLKRTKQGVAEGDVVQFPKKHASNLDDVHECVKCGGDLQGGTYMGQRIKVCIPCKQVYLSPNSNIDQQGNKISEQDIEENFADGKNPGRKGLAKRSGVNTKASVSSLRKTAKNSSGEKQRMAHWLANMKAGREKAKRK